MKTYTFKQDTVITEQCEVVAESEEIDVAGVTPDITGVSSRLFTGLTSFLSF